MESKLEESNADSIRKGAHAFHVREVLLSPQALRCLSCGHTSKSPETLPAVRLPIVERRE